MIELKLRKCLSEYNRFNKVFDTNADITLQGTFKESQNVLKPVIQIESSVNLAGYNYCEIPIFGRKYLMNVTVNNNKLWTLNLEVDVLSTYAAAIQDCDIFVKRCFKDGKNNYYINDGAYFPEQREVITYHRFKNNGVDATLGEESYYLMVAGS